MNRSHRGRTVFDRESHSFGCATAAVARGEHAGETSFQGAKSPIFFPHGQRGDGSPSEKKIILIPGDRRGQEVSPRLGPDKNEEAGRRFPRFLAVPASERDCPDVLNALD